MELRPESPLIIHMPLRNAQQVGNAGVRILAREGASGLTLKALGEELRMSGPGVGRWFGNVAQVRRVVVDQIGSRWVNMLKNGWREPLDDSWSAGDFHPLIPLQEHELTELKVWHTVVQAGLDDAALGPVVGRHAADEITSVRHLASRGGWRLSPDEERAILVTVRGLRQAMLQTRDPLPLEEAHEQLRSLVRLLVPRGTSQ